MSPKLANIGVAEDERVVPEALEAFAASGHAVFKFVTRAVAELDEIQQLVDAFYLTPGLRHAGGHHRGGPHRDDLRACRRHRRSQVAFHAEAACLRVRGRPRPLTSPRFVPPAQPVEARKKHDHGSRAVPGYGVSRPSRFSQTGLTSTTSGALAETEWTANMTSGAPRLAVVLASGELDSSPGAYRLGPISVLPEGTALEAVIEGLRALGGSGSRAGLAPEDRAAPLCCGVLNVAGDHRDARISGRATKDFVRSDAVTQLGHDGWSVVTGIAGQLLTRADACAVRSAAGMVTYGELWARAARVAAVVFGAASAGGELRVAIGLAPGAGWVACLLGIWRAGAVAVPVNLDHPPARLRLLADTADLLIHAVGDVPGWWADGKPAAAFPESGADVLPAPNLGIALGAGIACILHTSGSTGVPKPVALGHGALARRIAGFAVLYRITAADRIAQLAASSIDVAMWETLLSLTAGGTLCIPQGRQRVPGVGLVRWLAREQVTVATMTPTMLAALPERTLPDLRLLVVGGEAMDPARFRCWIDRHQVANAYGPTEATTSGRTACAGWTTDRTTPCARPACRTSSVTSPPRRATLPRSRRRSTPATPTVCIQ
ncbi:AMP-binding protein (plasmid) [Streptomyces sp. NBC_01724]|uniref:AMP-binding protein n=1 Tax=Streptomyces sp. NBC_01724 TaxID=2975922 RepID=UPI002E347B9C|nr:AMP-binding protein [Streptomyces sp. NBC_01724]